MAEADKRPSQVVTIFRSRLRPEAADEYHATAERMVELARVQPGFVDIKTFEADDGERVSLVTFESADAQRAWREHPEHRAAQRRGREAFYATYDITVCAIAHERHFRR